MNCSLWSCTEAFNNSESSVQIAVNIIKNIKIQDSLIKVINISTDNERFNIDSIIDVEHIKYVPLETKSVCLIANINKIIINKTNFYILDRTSKSIFIFSLEGKFINKISNVGKGPKEYVDIRDFEINSFKNEILLYDDFTSKILHYNLSGDFVKVEQTGFKFRNIRVLSSDKLLFGVLNAKNVQSKDINFYSILIASDLINIDYKGFKNSEAMISNPYVENDYFSSFGDDVIFSPRFVDTIYNINSKGQAVAKYYLKYENKIPKGFFNTVSNNSNFKKNVENKYTYFNGTFVENDSDCFFKLSPPDGIYKFCFYNKQTNKTLSFNSIYSLNANVLSFAIPINTFENKFLGILPAYSIYQNRGNLIKNKYKPISDVNLKLLNSIKEDDNPILTIYSMKY